MAEARRKLMVSTLTQYHGTLAPRSIAGLQLRGAFGMGA